MIRLTAKEVERIKLTPEEVERYAPYHNFAEFWIGFDEYTRGHMRVGAYEFQGVGGQAYDRGAELAMRRQGACRQGVAG